MSFPVVLPHFFLSDEITVDVLKMIALSDGPNMKILAM